MSMVQKWLSCLFLAVLGTALMLPVSAHAAPSISEVLPDHASMQSFITLYGSDFGDAQGTSYVTLGGRMLPVLVWTPNAVHVVVNPLAYNQAPVALNTVYPIQVVTSTGSSLRAQPRSSPPRLPRTSPRTSPPSSASTRRFSAPAISSPSLGLASASRRA